MKKVVTSINKPIIKERRDFLVYRYPEPGKNKFKIIAIQGFFKDKLHPHNFLPIDDSVKQWGDGFIKGLFISISPPFS